MGRLNVLCAGYRGWARLIFLRLDCQLLHRQATVTGPGELVAAFANLQPHIALFYGWSWIVPIEILQRCPCLCLHPSKLPAYRGGSPLQHQIIEGVVDSALTLFQMEPTLDTGPIVDQRPLSLRGHLAEIFERMTDLGTEMTNEVLSTIVAGQPLPLRPQDGTASYRPRRQPEESEIEDWEWAVKPALYLANKIRALSHPDYPAAYLRAADGNRLLLLQAEVARD